MSTFRKIVNDTRYKEWCLAPGYDPVNQTGGEWREGDDAYLIVYRDLSWKKPTGSSIGVC